MKVPLAIKNKTTAFQNTIKEPGEYNVLKPGKNNRKLGDIITKGRWKGKKIYSITLVERETCPPVCQHYLDCYGNHLHLAHRFKHGKELEDQIKLEIPLLLKKHKKGIVVRLHVLGDFYSLRYTNLWRSLLRKYDKLSVFGYTAYFPGTSIGDRIVKLNEAFRLRCTIRFSVSRESTRNRLYAAKDGYKGKGFTCPEAVAKVVSCASCQACWNSPRTVIFPTH